MWFDDDDDEEGDDEEQQLSAQPATSSRKRREDLKDPDYQIKSRSQILLQPTHTAKPKVCGHPCGQQVVGWMLLAIYEGCDKISCHGIPQH